MLVESLHDFYNPKRPDKYFCHFEPTLLQEETQELLDCLISVILTDSDTTLKHRRCSALSFSTTSGMWLFPMSLPTASTKPALSSHVLC